MISGVVKGEGPVPCRVMLVGESPGEDEAIEGRPFVGKTGQEQDAHFARNGIKRRDIYLTNLRKRYVEHNLAPTPEEIDEWAPVLYEEIKRVNPTFIITAGAHATRFFLGQSAHLDAIHAIPHIWKSDDGVPRIVIPVYHPAAHFYAPDLLQFIIYDYRQMAGYIRGDIPVNPAVDEFPEPEYIDATDRDVAAQLKRADADVAIDTEGYPGNEWSFQLSTEPGRSLVVRKDHPRFAQALAAFVHGVRGRNIIFHQGMYEVEMFRSLDVDLFDPALSLTFFDTMMAAYLHRIEPQSLKNLARRHCGMEMHEYMEVVGQAGLEKQIEYLCSILELDWPAPEPRAIVENDGTARMYKPQPIERRVEAILSDVLGGKVNKDGKPITPAKRWKDVDLLLRKSVEKVLGPLPIGTLADIPLDRSIFYSGRDTDATIRVYPKLKGGLKAAGLSDLMSMKMAMFPAAAEMKVNGILADRGRLENLREYFWEQMLIKVEQLSREYFGGRPINPGSGDQVATLMRKRGLKGEKKTSTGKMSTSKKSIEHLRFEDGAIELVEQWREMQKLKDSFATPLLEMFPDDKDCIRVSGDLKITRVTSGRFSMSEPNLLAIPTRTELGKKIREGFVAEDGYYLGAWDLDQIEMRIMADESRDERFVRLFRDGKIDIHTDTASKIFGVPYDQVDKMKHRYPAKRAGFLVITGGHDQALLDQLRMAGCEGWDIKRVAKLRREWFKLYPGVQAYMEGCKEQCRRNGGVIVDRWGMPNYLPAIFSDDQYLRWEAERQTHSHRIQGGAQGLLQNAMGWIYKELKPFGNETVRWLLQIHDELLFEFLRGFEDVLNDIVIEGLTKHGAKLIVPVKANGGWAGDWGTLER